MAVPLFIKRMRRERQNLDKPNDDYFVVFENDNLQDFCAYVVGPSDTLYEHKFVKLRFHIPDDYPLVSPKCTFVQHGGGRIHPNLYTEGKHEPHGLDNPQFNKYVQYSTWTWLLLDYLRNERNPSARAFLEKRVSQTGDKMIRDILSQQCANRSVNGFTSPYRCSDTKGLLRSNYPRLLAEVTAAIEGCRQTHPQREVLNVQIMPTNIIDQPNIVNRARTVGVTTEQSARLTTDIIPRDNSAELTSNTSRNVQASSAISKPDEKKVVEKITEVIDLT